MGFNFFKVFHAINIPICVILVILMLVFKYYNFVPFALILCLLGFVICLVKIYLVELGMNEV